MTRKSAWVSSLGVGVIEVILVDVLPLVGYALLVATIVLAAATGTHRAASVSGLLVGFGGFWLSLLASQAARGGQLDNAGVWIAVGAVPLVMGAAIGLATIRDFLRADRQAGPPDIARP